MKFFVSKKQPNPFRQPRKFIISTTPLFFGFYIFFKTVLSVLLGVIIYNLGVDSINGSSGLERLFFYWLGLAVIGVDFFTWVVLLTVDWAKKNKGQLFLALNVALVCFIIFAALLAVNNSDGSKATKGECYGSERSYACLN